MKRIIFMFIVVAISYAVPEYRKIILDNDLKVILVSDPSYNKSSASMNVGVGSLSDPKEYQGLAHFLEHMLFLGTDKYPDVDGYSAYLRSNGGYSNAYTAEDHTNYHYEVYHDAFEGALDRFSQFFIAPLFKQEYTQREMNAVNSEYQKNLEQDYWRMRQVKRNLYNPKHPANHFEIGTLETLSNVDRKVLLDFHQKYYSANMMSLSILSNLDLDSLELLAKKYFSTIKNSGREAIKYPTDYLEQKDILRLLKVKPVKDVKRLILESPTPSFYDLYDSKSDALIGKLMGHEGEGSLQSVLKSKGLAVGVGAWSDSATPNYGSLNIWVELTSEGFNQYKEVLSICFSYIEMLKKAGYQEFIFEEAKVLADLEEKYSAKGEGAGVAIKLANNLSNYPIEDAERIEFIYNKQDPTAYMKLLSYIRPDNMLATLSGYDVNTNSVEKWYSAEYSYEEIDNDFYQSLHSPPALDNLRLPSANPFMPTSTDILPMQQNIDDVNLIYDIKGMKVYHSRDISLNRPKAKLIYDIWISEDLLSLSNYLLGKLYIESVLDGLSEISYPARFADMEYSIKYGVNGISIEIGGYNSSIDNLMNIIIDEMMNIQIDEKRFSVIMDAQIRSLENKSLDAAISIAQRHVGSIVNEISYTPEEQLSIIRSITVDDVKGYWDIIRNNVFIEGSAHGNISAKETLKLSSKLRNSFGYKTISKDECLVNKRLDLDLGTKVTKVIESKVNNSAYASIYSIGQNSPRDRIVAMLIDTYISQPYYSELRTNQQLGYIVSSGAYSRNNYSGMYCVIQSDGYSADEVESRSLEFLSSAVNNLDLVSEDDFNRYKMAVREKIKERSTSILKEANKRHQIAFKFNNDVNRDSSSLNELDKITIDELKEVLSRTLSVDSQRNVTVLLYADGIPFPDRVKSSFDDLSVWKQSKTYK